MKRNKICPLSNRCNIQEETCLVKDNQEGQTLVEFLFLLIILISISFFMLYGIGDMVGSRWTDMAKIIAKPTQTQIELN